jgi:hypothetical protein
MSRHQAPQAAQFPSNVPEWSVCFLKYVFFSLAAMINQAPWYIKQRVISSHAMTE